MLLFAVVLASVIPLDGQGCAAVHIGSEGPFRFLVDTGATESVIDRSVAKRIGITGGEVKRAVSPTGELQVEEARVRDMHAGDFSVPTTAVLITTLPHLVHRGHVDGILGMSFFAGHSMLFTERRLLIDAPAGPGVSLEAHEVAGRVAINVEGLSFILDSGSGFVVLTSSRGRALAMRGGFAELTSAAGSRQSIDATIPHLRFGSIVIRDVAAVIAPRPDPREDGLLPFSLFESVFIAADRKSVLLSRKRA